MLPCDESCKVKADERQQVEATQRQEKEAAEEEQKRIEMEEFERKYGTKKPKERRPRPANVEEERNWTKIAMIAVGILVPVVSMLCYVILNNTK